jgi:hypothetical protein
MRVITEAQTELDAWRWEVETLTKVMGNLSRCIKLAELECESSRRVTGRAGNEHDVARLSRCAKHRWRTRCVTEHLYADTEWASSRVTADECNVVLTRKSAEAPSKAIEPGFVCLRKRQRQKRPRWMRAHGREVAEVYSQRAMTDSFCRKVLKKVIAEHERVDRGNELHARRAVEQCCVVAYAKSDISTTCTAVTKESVDQRELGEPLGRCV